MRVFFDWDDAKAENNFRKHGVRFEAAARVFEDPLAIFDQDRVEDGEQRWQALGRSYEEHLLLVAHTTHELDDAGEVIEVIRIISARRANRKESRRYGKDSAL